VALPDGRATDTNTVRSPRVSKGAAALVALPDGRATDTNTVRSPRVSKGAAALSGPP